MCEWRALRSVDDVVLTTKLRFHSIEAPTERPTECQILAAPSADLLRPARGVFEYIKWKCSIAGAAKWIHNGKLDGYSDSEAQSVLVGIIETTFPRLAHPLTPPRGQPSR